MHTLLKTWRVFVPLFFAIVCILIAFSTHVLEAAKVTIDSAVNITTTAHNGSSPTVVFTTEDTGYAFYVDGNGTCVYSKTTNGGVSWGTAVIVDSQADCLAVSVWYDQWTPGDTSGTFVHVATIDSSTDDIYYTRLDTANDSLSATINITQGSGYGGSLAFGANLPSITKSSTGVLFASVLDQSDMIVVTCSTTCTTAGNWSENSPTFSNGNDFVILIPRLSGNVMFILWDTSANDVQSKIFNGSTWDANWTDINVNAQDNTQYDASFGAVVDKNSGDVYLAYVNDASSLGTNDDIMTARYSGGSWTNRTDAVTDSVCAGGSNCGITDVKIARDQYSGDIYVLYAAQSTGNTASTGNVYYKRSTDGMATWGAESAALDSSDDDIYGARINLRGPRLYATWYAATPDSLFGETILLPSITVATTGTQTTPISVGQTNAYVGGSFSFVHDTSTTTMTSITITENGTVDAQNDLDNIRLYYDTDTTAPYDCASESYAGTEPQFGATDTDGFSGANGTSVFTGGISVSTSTAVCMYVVLDVLNSANNGDTIEIEISDPSTDVVTTYGIVNPGTVQALGGTTTLEQDVLTQTHYQWRNDNGSETTATPVFAGGSEDTPFTTFPANGNRRLRLQVSNEGSVTSASTALRLEYGVLESTCDAIGTWVDVGAGGGDWDMFDSSNITTDGEDTTDIAVSAGGVTNENSSFITNNNGLKDTSSNVSALTFTSSEFAEFEFSIQATGSATEGTSYCFRLTDAGTPLPSYLQYGRATIAADVLVSVVGTQTATTPIPTSNLYVGGAFAISENTSSRNVTGITITEHGSVDAQNDLNNIKLFYENDTSAPYDCASESYAGTESQFGTTDSDGFSSANGTSTFSGSVGITTTSTLCVYVVLDVLVGAQNNDTLDIQIFDSTTDVVVDGGGSTSPSAPRSLSGSTTLEAPDLRLLRFHFRNDDGSEGAATSATDGVENTALTGVSKNITTRLRMLVSNEGSVGSGNLQYSLQYGVLSSSCSAIGSWIDVGDPGGAFDMSDSLNLTDGADTQNISNAIGGVTDVGGSSFETPNGAVKDTSSQTGNINLSANEFVEIEYSIEATDAAVFTESYCFRVTVNTTEELTGYDVYPTLTMRTSNDFFIQRGVTTIDNGNTTASITAGSEYVAPRTSSNAFIRITNTAFTGAGHNVGGGTQRADDVTTVISNPDELQTGITFTRFGATDTTRIYWEIIEYIGPQGGDNEMVVRYATSTPFGINDLAATTSVSGVVDDGDMVVFVTGSASPDTGTNDFNTMLVTSDWSASTDEAVLTRGESSGDDINVSWAAVEFTGANWVIQRAEHTYVTAVQNETETITDVNDTSRAFIHAQIRSGASMQGQDEFGHEVWMENANEVLFRLESTASTPSDITSVAWVIENTQTTGTPMNVIRSNGTQSGGAEPSAVIVNITQTIAATSTASIFVTNRTTGTGTFYPRPIMGARIISTTQYELWLSDTGDTRTYRTEVVEWPTAVRSFTQNYYRFYVDDDNLDPLDPWPPTPPGGDLGENFAITSSDTPLSQGDRVRIRMSVTVRGSNLTASTTAFKLEYGARSTSCSAITEWFPVGEIGSTTAAWRGYDASPVNGASLSGNPPTINQLNLSVSDRAGSYVEEYNSPGNPYKVFIGEDVEYDFIVENNIANSQTFYCFRMVEYDDTVLDAYSFYPTILTSGFQVQSQNWQWFNDENSLTPSVALAAENVAPSSVTFDNLIKLRVTAKETGGGGATGVKFRLEFSEFSDFSQDVFSVEEIGSCTTASLWCYADGAGDDNATTTGKVLSDSDACTGLNEDGCGSHNESGLAGGNFIHNPSAAAEYEFTIHQYAARPNTTYFFRLYDVVNNAAVPTAGTYPSLTAEGAALTFSISGLSSGTATEGVTTDVTTTANEVPFGTLAPATEIEAAQRLTVSTNATAGYRIFTFAQQGLLSGSGEVTPTSGTNATPSSWSGGCGTSCYGYHAGDDVLQGSSGRFAPNDTYAQFTSSIEEVAFSAIPITNDVNDIVYKLQVPSDQPAGQYSTSVIFIIVPVF